MGDGENSKRQDFELECEAGGKRDWCEAAPVDGNGSVVETKAQNWTPLDREVQHECADSHQRTSALLGQNRQLGHLREGLEMSGTSVVEMEYRCGRILCRRWYPKAVEMQMGVQNL